MVILHLSTRDNQGGAARATYRLHRGLETIGANSEMLVQRRITNDQTVDGAGGRVGKAYDSLRRKLDELPARFYQNRRDEIFSPAWIPERVASRVREHNPDVVNLHWVAGGFLHPDTIQQFDASIVWTLHDMWPFTGGCHYAGECTKYGQQCGACPHLGSENEDDLSRSTWERKSHAWRDASFSIVAPSEWLADCARESSLFAEANVSVIPNGLDVTSFRPRDPNAVREELGIDVDTNLICFGADWETPRKGADLLYDALEKLDLSSDSTEVAVFGHTKRKKLPEIDIPVTNLGFVEERVLHGLYSDADTVIVPSRQEAFGQTASEALASGTPVVAFDATGPRDIVDHKQTGYLAEPFDTADLARGIEWILSDENRRQEMSRRAREVAVERYSIETIARQYRDLYNQVK